MSKFESRAPVRMNSGEDVFWCYLPDAIDEKTFVGVQPLERIACIDEIFDKFDESEHQTAFFHKGDEGDRLSDDVVEKLMDYLREDVSDSTAYYAVEDNLITIAIHKLNEERHTPLWGVHLYLYYEELE